MADGATDWAALPIDLADIERIEIVRGPASLRYGGGASAGVVNITYRDGNVRFAGNSTGAGVLVVLVDSAIAAIVRRYRRAT